MSFLSTLQNDIQAILKRDPAARSGLEVVLCYPGLHAIWAHRVAHGLWRRGFKLLARWVSQTARWLTGIEIHPGARLGRGFFIDHGMGVVIGETAEVGADVTLYHGVTLGGTSLNKGKRHPTLGDRVVVGAGAKILGDISIGSDSRIGANAVVVKPVPENAVVVGVPGQVVSRTSRPQPTPDLEHSTLPDTLGLAVAELLTRVDALEARLSDHAHPPAPHHIHAPDHGAWHGEDFSI